MIEQSDLKDQFGWIEQLKPLLGPSLPDFLHSYELPPVRGLRVRPGRTPPPEAEEPVSWAECAYYLPLDSTAGTHPLHEAGAYYIQEPSAMAAAAALHPEPDDKVLDLCAAPGGKSTQMAAYMHGKGLLVCNDPVLSRAQELSHNLERMGVPNAVVISVLPDQISGKWTAFFDKILVDAPCSGEGMFRRHPQLRREWSPESPAGCASRQSFILKNAAMMLRPGGLLAYSTCTFNATENEGVIEDFLQEHRDFSLVPFSLAGLPKNNGMLHLWPHQIRGEGHFVALLKRIGADLPPSTQKKKGQAAPSLPAPAKDESAAAAAFLKEHYTLPLSPNALFAGKIVQAPVGLPPLNGLKTLRVGLQLGEMKGRVFVPDHALALFCPSRNSIEITVEQARHYQAGQVLSVSESLHGFVTPVLDGLALGWGKASNGQLKNHYPKGLRRY